MNDATTPTTNDNRPAWMRAGHTTGAPAPRRETRAAASARAHREAARAAGGRVWESYQRACAAWCAHVEAELAAAEAEEDEEGTDDE